jgi:hypothetical protein
MIYIGNCSKDVSKLKVGDSLLTYSGNVKSIKDKHELKSILFDLNVLDNVITLNENHEILKLQADGIRAVFTKVKDIQNGDYIQLPKYNGIDKLPESINCSFILGKDKSNMKMLWEIDEDFCQFLGIWYNNGCVNETNNMPINVEIVLYKEKQDLASLIVEQGIKIFDIEPEVVSLPDKNLTHIIFNSPTLAFLFKKLFGGNSEDKKVYPGIHNWNIDYVNHLMHGMLLSDGNNKRVTMGNVSFVNELFSIFRSRELCVTLVNDNKIAYLYDASHKKKYAGDHAYAMVDSIVLSNKKTGYMLELEDDDPYLMDGIIVKSCSYNCFLPDTMVFTEKGVTKMKDIKCEDKILTFDIDTNSSVFSAVKDIIISKISNDVIEIKTAIGTNSVKMTPEHKLYIRRDDVISFMPASEAFAGDYLGYPEKRGVLWFKIQKISLLNYEGDVYDLIIKDNENYTVVNLGIVKSRK